MGSYGIYKLFGPSSESGKSMKILVEWSANKQAALRMAEQVRSGVCDPVQSVEVVDCASGGDVVFRAECEPTVKSR
jgi:hypothetical protein